MKLVNDLLDEYLEEYNMNFSGQMHLVFFTDAIRHLSRICRLLRQPRGSACLVGIGGSGRQSLVRLGASMNEIVLFQIEITRGYGLTEFREDLKNVLLSAGGEGKPTVFLFSDTQIVEESFVEDVSNLLNSGEVPNLWAEDEISKIVSMVRPLAKAAGKLETKDGVLAHYVTLVRDNLHIMLSMSPIGVGFRARCRQFPALVNCTTIDWYVTAPLLLVLLPPPRPTNTIGSYSLTH